jgi:hypothetical protein
MKRVLYFIFSLLLIACAEHDIPSSAKTFISQYFPESSVVLTEMGDDENGEYSVWLNDGTKIDFEPSGQWKRVSRKRTGVPDSLIPSTIAQHIKANYPDEAVFMISRKSYGFKIMLSSDLDMKFDNQGHLLEVDD